VSEEYLLWAVISMHPIIYVLAYRRIDSAVLCTDIISVYHYSTTHKAIAPVYCGASGNEASHCGPWVTVDGYDYSPNIDTAGYQYSANTGSRVSKN
jgi:hypothetical protein